MNSLALLISLLVSSQFAQDAQKPVRIVHRLKEQPW